MDYTFLAVVEPDPDGGYLVSFPDVPEALTSGNDLTEAKDNAADALGMALRGYLAKGLALPRPVAEPGEDRSEISVDVTDALKLAVIEAFTASGMPKAELARRLGKAETEARRILDPDHHTKASALEAALAVLGKRVVVSVLDAAA
ncbi:type II toxin-antitoxin system HicB family antitoxin [Mesorhizobium xinjiangense]|uniref:type II toxin-antitoxin system HicB family antitoxin n=1 Tax=Mesorhizobium xinjiangense TaxID=2678685 RepID=UPI0012EEB14E|nr:type II toxin-antitoxin system HicB family antitoxin [Mesorhizobium xinjiangense]